MRIGFKEIKAVFRQVVEKVLSLAHAGNTKKVGSQTRFCLEVMAAKSIPANEAWVVSNGRVQLRIINLATGNPKEG